MAALVGALRAMLSLDSTAFVDGSEKALRSKRKLEGGLQSLTVTLRRVGMAVAVAGGALAVMVKGQLNAADEMGKAAQKFGVGVEELSRLKYAADLSDVSLQTLGGSLGRLSRAMVAARDGGKAQQRMFAELGVSVTDATGQLRSAEAVMQDVAGVFASMPDGAEKTALAIKLFGKSGAEMIPLLNAGKTGLQEMSAEAERFGVVVTAETAKAAEQFNDNLTRLKTAGSGLLMNLTAEMAPVLAKLTDWAVEAANGFQSLDPVIRTQLYDAFVLLGGSVAGAIELIGMALAKIHEGIVILGGSVAGAVELIYLAWSGLASWFTDMWATIQSGTLAAWDGIKSAIGGAITYVTGLWDTFVGKLTAAIQTAKDVGREIAEALSAGREEMNSGNGYGGMGGAGDEFGTNMFGAGQDGGNGLVDGFTGTVVERQGEIDAVADQITQRVRDKWQIRSPSRVFQEIGRFLSEGLGLGIKDGKPGVDQAMDEVGEGIQGKADSLASRLESVKSTFQNAFVGLVTGAMSFKEALGQVAMSLAKMAAEAAFQQLFGNLFKGGGLLGGLFGFANGGAFANGRVMAFASGGVVDGATAFGMQGGLGVMGEAGPEAIMPLARGRGGKLGVVAQGGGVQKVQLEITEGDMFASRVRVISDESAVAVTRTYDREVAPQSRSRNPRERG